MYASNSGDIQGAAIMSACNVVEYRSGPAFELASKTVIDVSRADRGAPEDATGSGR